MTNSNGRSHGGQNNDEKNENTRNKSSTIDTEKPKFTLERDQAENCERLAKHVTNAVQKKFGAPIAHALMTEEDHEFADVTMEMPELPVTNETDKAKTTRETCDKEKQQMHKIDVEDQKKKMTVCINSVLFPMAVVKT